MTTDEQAKRIAELEAQLAVFKTHSEGAFDAGVAYSHLVTKLRAERDAALSQVAVLRNYVIAGRVELDHAGKCADGGRTQDSVAYLVRADNALEAALVSTQATADAWRASIRREALEDATTACLEVAADADGDDPFHSGATCCVDRIRALATRGTP